MNARITAAALLGLTSIYGMQMAHAITQTQYDAASGTATHEYAADKAACEHLAGNANDICMARANGTYDIARAELNFALSGAAADKTTVFTVRAASVYAIASEVCDDKAGNSKDVCLEEAKAARAKTLASVELVNEVRAASREAQQDRRDADYKVATTKCEVLSGTAQANCVAAADLKFGK